MKISDLKAGQGKVDIVVQVTDKAEPRVMQKYGKELKVCSATVKDDSGEITMTLWNDDVDKVNVGDSLKISNGYVSEFNGNKQLTSGKYGKLEVVSGSASSENEEEKKEIKKEKKAEKKDKKVKEDSEEFEDVEF
jgi:replication factor A1